LIGPVVAYVAFGSLWLWEHGWLWIAALLWIAAGTAFSILAARWTKSIHPIMPPIDWESPSTFSPRDRDAWKLVEEEADTGNGLEMEGLLEPDLYGQTGRHLLRKLATFYHPNTSHPLDDVPLVDLLTAIELAAEDLAQLSRQIPGGDMITLSHWRRAVQMAGYISRANDIYAILSPILNPLSGLARLGTRELIVKPAWRDMQQNVLRWFYQAYVNRLGVHLIELMSGRLAIGAEQYRRLTRRKPLPAIASPVEDKPLVAAVVGARGSGKSRLIETMKQAFAGEPSLIMARFEALGLAPSLVEQLRNVTWVEVAGYAPSENPESRRDRSLRQSALRTAIECDLLILVISARNGIQPADVALAQAWDRHFLEHPQRDAPPTLVVITGADHPDFGTVWSPPYDWTAGKGVREASIRALFESLRATLPPTFNTFTATGLSVETPFGVAEHLVPALVAQLHRAERSALIRHLQSLSGRSKVGRVVSQLGQQGRQIWSNLKLRRKAAARAR
jgi:predicted GTPase